MNAFHKDFIATFYPWMLSDMKVFQEKKVKKTKRESVAGKKPINIFPETRKIK